MVSIHTYNPIDVRDLEPHGYPGYRITRDGNVWSDKSNCWLKRYKSRGDIGDYYVKINCPGTRRSVLISQLMSKTFVIPDLIEQGFAYASCMDSVDDEIYLVHPDGRLYRGPLMRKSGGWLNHNSLITKYTRKDGTRVKIKYAQIVAHTFIPNPNNYKWINHKDGNRLNIRADNLEWVEKEIRLYRRKSNVSKSPDMS